MTSGVGGVGQLLPNHWYKIKSEHVITIDDKEYYNFECSLATGSEYTVSILILPQHMPKHVEYTMRNMDRDEMYLQSYSYEPNKKTYTIVFSCTTFNDDEITLNNDDLEWVYTTEKVQLQH